MTPKKNKYISGILLIGVLALIGAGCTTAPDPNTNAEETTVVAKPSTETAAVETRESSAQVIGVEEQEETDAVEKSELTEEVDTSDWLTYTNEEFGFSFHFPKSWSVGNNGTATFADSPETVEEIENAGTIPHDFMVTAYEVATDDYLLTTGDLESDLVQAQDNDLIHGLEIRDGTATFQEENSFLDSTEYKLYAINQDGVLLVARYIHGNVFENDLSSIMNTFSQ